MAPAKLVPDHQIHYPHQHPQTHHKRHLPHQPRPIPNSTRVNHPQQNIVIKTNIANNNRRGIVKIPTQSNAQKTRKLYQQSFTSNLNLQKNQKNKFSEFFKFLNYTISLTSRKKEKIDVLKI